MKFCDENSKSYFVNISKPEIASGLQPVLIHELREDQKRAKAQLMQLILCHIKNHLLQVMN